MVLDVSDSGPSSDSGELFVDPDLERIRKKNVQAEAKRATHKHVKTQQNKWKALFGGIPTSKTFVDSKLAPYVAKTFEDHPNPAQAKQI